MVVAISAPMQALLGSDAVAHVWTSNPDGSPQVSVVWVIAQDDELATTATTGTLELSESVEEAAAHAEIREELAIDITVGQQLIIVKHSYTHFRITLHAYHAQYVSGTPQHIGVADHAWVTLTDLDNYAFATADRQIIAALRTSFLA